MRIARLPFWLSLIAATLPALAPPGARAQIVPLEVVVTGSQQGRTLLPGETGEVFRLQITNQQLFATALTEIRFHNRTTGPGNQTQLDADWAPVTLWLGPNGGPGSGTYLATAGFSSTVARFDNFRVPIAGGKTVELIVMGGPALVARDADVLDMRIVQASSFKFENSPPVGGTFPIDPAGDFLVDGMSAAQITVTEIPAGQFQVGSAGNLAFDFHLRPNGYQNDVLSRLEFLNLGTALAGEDMAAVHVWLDDGNGAFDPGSDFLLGSPVFTGGINWMLTGLTRTVDPSGLRLFVSVDLSDQATEGRTVQLALSSLPDLGVGMASPNDGPLDRPVGNSAEHTVSDANRVTLAAVPIAPGTVAPGQSGVPLFQVAAINSYDVERAVTKLHFSNFAVGPGSIAELDQEMTTLTLREDGDDDGVLDDPATDPVLGTAFFSAGRASFSIDWKLPPQGARFIFLTADVSLTAAADGDLLSAGLAGPADVEFSDPTTLVASWPVSSGAWPVDGMVAAQVQNGDLMGVTLGPGDGPALALDVRVPRNGYADDVLERVSVLNQGTAVPADLADVRLWRDGGDGVFDASAGDDADLGPLTDTGSRWESATLAEPLGASGARLFVSVVAAAAPTDSATVRLELPVGGVEVASDDDGPLDAPVTSPQPLLLSYGPLLATLQIIPSASVVGQNLTVRMTVRNVGVETVDNVTPTALAVQGTGAIGYVSGPVPASASIPSGLQQTFDWTWSAASAGDVEVVGGATGTGNPSGQPDTAQTVTSNTHHIFDQAQEVQLWSSAALPTTVGRGQSGVVALNLTFLHPDGSSGSDIRVRGLRVRLENDVGAGIVPADLLSRVQVVGGVVHLDRTSLETTGSEVDLTLATPIIVSGSDPVGVALVLDISASTVVPLFRIVVPDSTWFTAEDATSGAPVAVLHQATTFPVTTGLARVQEPATRLDVSNVPGPPQRASGGQLDVSLLTAQLQNPGVTGLTADVRVTSLAVGLVDSNGTAVAEPSQVIKRIRARVFVQTLADRPVGASDDSVFTLNLSPLLSVPVNTPLDLRLSADVADSAALGLYRLRLGPASSFDARDASNGFAVPVTYATDPIEGAAVTLESRADTLRLRGIPQLPESVAVGAANVTALTAVLRHPGAPGTARLRLDSLAVRCWDAARNLLPPSIYVDRLRVLWNDTLTATLSDPPPSGAMAVSLGGRALERGDSARVTLVLDFEATAPASTFELVLGATGLAAADYNLGTPAAVVTEDGWEFPLLSGLTRLQPPPRTLLVGLEDLMPANLAADGREVAVGRLTLTNDAAPGSGAISLDRLVLRAGDADRDSIPIGAAALQVAAWLGGTPWATSAALTPDSTIACLLGAGPLLVQAGQPVTLELRMTPRTNPAVDAVALRLPASGVGVVQPGSALLQIAVQPQGGQAFPLWTSAGSFTTLALESSYSNFPNPFAAGRELTRFAFYLPAAGRITLRIWTARGERVATLLDGASRGAGLHQGDAWDGRNGRGAVVVNGVYVAELVAELDDGTRERLLRRVAVVR
jgi:hypothetical protein